MEWTGARYADAPTVEDSIVIDAPPEAVWQVVADPLRAPEFSDELQRVEWVDDGPTAPGRRFRGFNAHASFGEWSVESHIIAYQPNHEFAWAVNDPDDPAAVWRFTLEPVDGGTRLTQWAQLGPGRSGLSYAIRKMPDKEQKIVFVRLREWEAGMARGLAGIKAAVESSIAEHSTTEAESTS